MPYPLLTNPAVPVGPKQGPTRDPRRRWTIVASLLLHLLAIGMLLIIRRAEPPMSVAPSYDLVFENGGSATPPTAPGQPDDTPSEAPTADLPAVTPLEPPTPSPDASTVPDVPDPEPLPPAPTPEPTLEEPAPQPFPEPVPAPEAAPTPETAPTPQPPAVRLGVPEPAAPLSPQALAPELPALVPPPPLPPLPTPPRPGAQALPRPGAFPPPIDLNFGPAASRAPVPRITKPSRAIDFSLGAPKPGPNKSEAFFDIRAANIGADWAQGVAAYWQAHRYYPRQAAQNGEDGTVQIELVVNRLGRVESIEIQRRSGSPWLDMAAVGTWRNAQLAPLPAENTDRTITIPLTINYVLIR